MFNRITNLTLTDCTWRNSGSTTPLLAAVAHSLRNLELFIGPDVQVGDTNVPFFPKLSRLVLSGDMDDTEWLLGSCPALKSLEFKDLDPDIFDSIPIALSFLLNTCRLRQVFIPAFYFIAIQMPEWEKTFALPALRSLKTLTITELRNPLKFAGTYLAWGTAELEAWRDRFEGFLEKREETEVWVEGDVQGELWGGLERLWYM
jgi:hypothetical protein